MNDLQAIDDRLAVLNAQIVQMQEEITILNRLRDLRTGFAGNVNVVGKTVAPTAKMEGETPRRRGRPAKVKTEGAVASNKTLPLPKLLVHLATEAHKPLTFAEIADMVEKSGYQTDAKNPSNMVYQCLRKLTLKGVFAKDNDHFKLNNSEAAA